MKQSACHGKPAEAEASVCLLGVYFASGAPKLVVVGGVFPSNIFWLKAGRN